MWEIKSSHVNTLDELFGLFIFESDIAEAFSAIHPSQFLFSTKEPGLSSAIGPLDQNFVCLEKWAEEDPDIDHFKIV